MQFQQQQQLHQQQLHQQQQQQHAQHLNQQQQRHQQQLQGYPQQQQHLPHHQHPQHQQQVQSYNDQLLAQVDPTLAQRPLPPQHNGAGWNGGGGGGGGGGQQEQVQAALRVRQWIETRTVSYVRKIRPILNQEIHQGFLLKKNGTVNDRSTPRV